MPRPPRIHLDGAAYYVTSRAVAERWLFRDEQDFRTYLSLLADSQRRLGIKLFAYVLLPDQVHLGVELPHQVTLSAFMHAMHSRYTKYFIKRYEHRGPVFQSRFRSTIVEKVPWRLRLTGYLHALPTWSGATEANKGCRWSSDAIYRAASMSFGGSSAAEGSQDQGASHAAAPAHDASAGLDLDASVREVLACLAAEHPNLTYAQYIESLDQRQWRALSDELRHWVVGSEAFLAQAEQERNAASRNPIEALRGLEPPVRPALEPARGPRESWRPTGLAFASASLLIAALGAWAASWSTHPLSSLRRTVRALVSERMTLMASNESPAPFAMAQLATFREPPRLTGTVWRLHIKPMDETATATMRTDELHFAGGKLTSASLTAQGFSSSNYSLSAAPQGPVQWETMQTGPHGEIVCWRGAWKEHLMRGIMTRQLPGQPVENYEFVGSQLSSEEPRSET